MIGSLCATERSRPSFDFNTYPLASHVFFRSELDGCVSSMMKASFLVFHDGPVGENRGLTVHWGSRSTTASAEGISGMRRPR